MPRATSERSSAKSLASSAISGRTPARAKAASTTCRVEEPRWNAISRVPAKARIGNGSSPASGWPVLVATASSSLESSSRSHAVGWPHLERERDVEAAVGQHLEHPLRRALAQSDLDVGKAGGEAGDHRRDVELAAEQHRADVHVPAREAAQLVDVAAQRVGLGEHCAGAGRDQLARLGRHHRSRRAAQQLDAELLLEPAHLVRQGRLRDAQLVGGAREMAVPRDRLEVAKLTELDRYIVYRDKSDDISVLHR